MAIDGLLRGGWNGWSDRNVRGDRHTRRFAPFVGHWTDTVGVNQDGAIVAGFHATGHAADLAGVRANLAAHLRDNAMARGIADPRIQVWVHVVRRDGQTMTALPAAGNWYADRFDAAYRDAQGDGLFRNDLFVTFVMHQAVGLRDLVAGGTSDTPEVADSTIEEFEDVLSRAEAGLARYGVRRLGVRERNGVVFSELAEAQHLIANGKFRPIGLINGRLGRLVVPDRIVFGHRDFHIMGEGPPVFGAIVSILAYPARTSPMMFSALRHVRFPMTITSAQRFHRKSEALGSIGLRVKQMQSGNDAARSQMLELAQDEDDVASGRSVYVTHHFSIVVRAASLEELDRRVAIVLSLLSDAGVTGTRETDGLVPAFYGQLPGNRRWWPRPAQIKSINAVAFAPLHDVPRGRYQGRWGPPIIMLRTTADTEYAFHFHVQGSAQIPAEDLGNCMVFGPAGSGKTGLTGRRQFARVADPRRAGGDRRQGLRTVRDGAGGRRDPTSCCRPVARPDWRRCMA